PNLAGGLFGERHRRRAIGGASEDLHLDLGEVRAISDRNAGKRALDPSELLADDALGKTERAKADLVAVVRSDLANARHDLLIEHALHFARNSRHEERVGAADLDGEACRSSNRVRKNRGSPREVGLLGVRLGHRASELLEPTANVIERGLVAFEADAD